MEISKPQPLKKISMNERTSDGLAAEANESSGCACMWSFPVVLPIVIEKKTGYNWYSKQPYIFCYIFPMDLRQDGEYSGWNDVIINKKDEKISLNEPTKKKTFKQKMLAFAFNPYHSENISY